ncbi:MAG TPA: hypothetical protein VND64_23535 [Pirellulales bacterium]|nr:hypothetical protein [Pirellulales bacterium]
MVEVETRPNRKSFFDRLSQSNPLSQRPLLLLFLGTLPIAAGAIAFSRRATGGGDASTPSSEIAVTLVDGTSDDGNRASTPSRDEAVSRPSLETACRETAAEIAERLGEGCNAIVRAPFVLAGDLDLDELDHWHEETIAPAARAMASCYFDTSPNEPITVLLFSDRAAYDRQARSLYGDKGISVYGYYKPDERALLLNIGTGGGTLVHELTHALIDFDFPAVPDWFNEGLASLHEQCRIHRDEAGIDGQVNWRLPGLQTTIRAGRLRSLEAMIRDDDFRGTEVGLNYAYARYFCLFLQSDQNPRRRNVLAEFYSELRAHQASDPQGLNVVGRVFSDQSWAQLDAAFREFVLELKP